MLGYFFGAFLAKTSEDADTKGDAASKVETIADEDIIAELNEKIDSYEETCGMFSPTCALHPFTVSQLDDSRKLMMALYMFSDDELKTFDVSDYDESNTYDDVELSIDVVAEQYRSFFGDEFDESKRINVSLACTTPIFANFDYDADNQRYIASKAPGNCGGALTEFADSYRDTYETDGEHAFVTVEIGYTSYDQYQTVMAYDYHTFGESEWSQGITFDGDADFVNAETKDKYAKYQYIFDKQDDGKWAFRGLYPLDWNK